IAAAAASFTFFFALGYGARLLAPVMTSRRAWQLLDLGIGLVMWVLAATLIRGL
ncbi:MAG: amino acid transporter, partial [Paracoccaceae bacterium]